MSCTAHSAQKVKSYDQYEREENILVYTHESRITAAIPAVSVLFVHFEN